MEKSSNGRLGEPANARCRRPSWTKKDPSATRLARDRSFRSELRDACPQRESWWRGSRDGRCRRNNARYLEDARAQCEASEFNGEFSWGESSRFGAKMRDPKSRRTSGFARTPALPEHFSQRDRARRNDSSRACRYRSTVARGGKRSPPPDYVHSRDPRAFYEENAGVLAGDSRGAMCMKRSRTAMLHTIPNAAPA